MRRPRTTHEQYTSKLDKQLKLLDIELGRDVTTALGKYDELGGAFVEVNFYDFMLHARRREGLLRPRPVPHSCAIQVGIADVGAVVGEAGARTTAAAILAAAGVDDAAALVASAIHADVVVVDALRSGSHVENERYALKKPGQWHLHKAADVVETAGCEPPPVPAATVTPDGAWDARRRIDSAACSLRTS